MAEPFYIIDNAKFEMVNSKYAMTTICNILMNLVVLENKVVEDAHIFYHLLKFIMNTLPSLENNGEVRYWVSLRPPAPPLSHLLKLLGYQNFPQLFPLLCFVIFDCPDIGFDTKGLIKQPDNRILSQFRVLLF